MSRWNLTTFILTFIILLLAAILSSEQTEWDTDKGLLFNQTERLIKEYQWENRLLEERILEMSSLRVIEARARSRGFINGEIIVGLSSTR